MRRSKIGLWWWPAIINYKFFFSAILSTLSLSCILFVFALLNDRGKPIDRLLIVDSGLSSGRLLNTKLFDDKRTFFDLVDDTEWRLKNGRHNNLNNRLLNSNNNNDNNNNRNIRGGVSRIRTRRNIDGELSNSETFVDGSSTLINVNNDFDCDTVAGMVPTMSFLASGWTKAVYKAKYNNFDLAVKTVDITGQDVSRCLENQQQSGGTAFIKEDELDDEEAQAEEANRHTVVGIEKCYRKAERKIIKEIALLKQLEHPNIIKVLGYCIPKKPDAKDSRRRVAIVTELGEPVNLIRLLQLSWEDRLRIVLSLAQLLKYLAHHDLGSLVMNDMRRQQFVVINGELKLVDVDDIGLEEPKCRQNDDCSSQVTNLYANLNEDHLINNNNGSSLKNSIQCVDGYCRGFNEVRNIFNTARHFTTFLLPYGAPVELQQYVNYVVENFKNLTTDSDHLFRLVDDLVKTYSNGSYLQLSNRTNKEFVKVVQSDLTGLHDYSCQGSKTQISCSLSMSSPEEAESLCANQPVCKAFVWTNEKTWTGRNIVHFKNNVSSPVHNVNTVLYLKV